MRSQFLLRLTSNKKTANVKLLMTCICCIYYICKFLKWLVDEYIRKHCLKQTFAAAVPLTVPTDRISLWNPNPILLFLFLFPASEGQDGQAEEEGGDWWSCSPSKERWEACCISPQGEEKESRYWQSLHQHLYRPLHIQPDLVLLCPLYAVHPGQTGGDPAPVTSCPGCQLQQCQGFPREVLGLIQTSGLLWHENQESKVYCDRWADTFTVKLWLLSTFVLEWLKKKLTWTYGISVILCRWGLTCYFSRIWVGLDDTDRIKIFDQNMYDSISWYITWPYFEDVSQNDVLVKYHVC